VKLSANQKRRYEERARLMKALAHPTRLFIVDELAKGERCVSDLQALVGVDISTVSKHLALLRAAGVITDDKRGLQVFYRLQTPCVLNIFECVREVQDAVKPVTKARNTG
jgi:ArsR family transcriptional regulator